MVKVSFGKRLSNSSVPTIFAAGNKRFRNLCESHAAKYAKTKSKIEKSLVVMSIVDAVREGSKLGGFVKKVSWLSDFWTIRKESCHEVTSGLNRVLSTSTGPQK